MEMKGSTLSRDFFQTLTFFQASIFFFLCIRFLLFSRLVPFYLSPIILHTYFPLLLLFLLLLPLLLPFSLPSHFFFFLPATHSVPSPYLCVEIRLQQWTLRVMVMECIGGASSFLSPTCMQNPPDGASLAPVCITKRGCGLHGNTIALP